jgi:hypothetical protein
MTATILALLDDLFLLPRIQDVARDTGYQIKHISAPGDLGINATSELRSIPLTEPLEGPEAVFIRHVSALRPALILVDARAKRIPWAAWIQVLKTSAATRRIPILVYGPHVEGDLLERASALGADAVVTRGSFNNRMAELINKHSRTLPDDELQTACEGALPKKVLQGIDLHNQGDFMQAHEWFEEAWMAADEMEGYLYRALLQLTVTEYHLTRNNLRGAQKMLLRIHQWLDPLPPVCRTVDVAAIKDDVASLRQHLDHKKPSSDLLPTQIRLVS